MYYHTSVSAGGDVALAREVEIGKVPANLSATLSARLNADVDLGLATAVYVFATPFLGGQAVVGMITPTAARPTSGDSNAKQVAHAPQPALRSADPKREAMPVPNDAERKVPDARRAVPRGSEGQ